MYVQNVLKVFWAVMNAIYKHRFGVKRSWVQRLEGRFLFSPFTFFNACVYIMGNLFFAVEYFDFELKQGVCLLKDEINNEMY